MKKHVILLAILVVATLPGIVGPVSADRSLSGFRTQDCTSDAIPEVVRVAEGDLLQQGLLYLVKGPRLAVIETFPERIWEAPFGNSSNWAALVSPSESVAWPHTSTASAYNAWRIIQGWRTPFLMFSSLDSPMDVVSLGIYDANWRISAQALDHLISDGVERPAWIYLVREDGSERMLGQVELTDPAFISITVPERGEVQFRTHDSIVWWVQCLPLPTIAVTKTANPESRTEPGGTFEFAVRVDNTSSVDLTLTSLFDDVYGNISDTGNPLINRTTCAVPQAFAPGGFYQCAFEADVYGRPGDSQTDIVTATARDEMGNEVQDADDATVHITDIPSAIKVTKVADPTTVLELGDNVEYTVVVENTSSVDDVTIHSILDNQFGDISGSCDTVLPATLVPGQMISCAFVEFVGGQPGDTHTNLVTASGIDDDGHPVSDSDDATVTVLNVPSAIEVIKTATPPWMHYPGGDVTFRFTVNNLSTVDSVIIDSLTDTIYGDLDGRGNCSVPQPLPVGGSYTCSFIAYVSGEPDTTHINVVTASGIDDDGYHVSGQDEAVVTIATVPTRVELLYFRASVECREITVEWETAWEQNNWGFHLYRSLMPDFEGATWVTFEQAEGSGSFEGQYYIYDDRDIAPGQIYYYWLEGVDVAGSTTHFGPATAFVPHRIYLPAISN
jgi:uncharacterized repeat protein (TIGR01451 family)